MALNSRDVHVLLSQLLLLLQVLSLLFIALGNHSLATEIIVRFNVLLLLIYYFDLLSLYLYTFHNLIKF